MGSCSCNEEALKGGRLTKGSHLLNFRKKHRICGGQQGRHHYSETKSLPPAKGVISAIPQGKGEVFSVLSLRKREKIFPTRKQRNKKSSVGLSVGNCKLEMKSNFPILVEVGQERELKIE